MNMRSLNVVGAGVLVSLVGILFAGAQILWAAGVIDPFGVGNQYATFLESDWGTVNWKPAQGTAVSVTDSAITGDIWGDKAGWIDLAPTNGGVLNDGLGNLSGHAWSETCGWINFAPTNGGVSITGTGKFSGHAWAENCGWLKFECPGAACVATNWSEVTFTLSASSIGFGTLASDAARYATSDGLGSASETEAYTMVASTNATDGYVVKVSGTTLANGYADTIDIIGGANTASSPGSEQFGMRLTASGGSGSVSAPYAASGFAYDGVSSADEIASASGPSAATTYSVRMLANIADTTEAGAYSTTLIHTMIPTF